MKKPAKTAALIGSLALVNLSLFTTALAMTGPNADQTPSTDSTSPTRVRQSGFSQQTIHDATVTDIQASPAMVTQGEPVLVDVSVANQGGVQETISVSLWDSTDNREIQGLFVSLIAGQFLTIGLQWDTANASSGFHTLAATAYIADDEDASNDSRSIGSPIEVLQAGITFGDENGSMLPKDWFGSGLLNPNLNTQPQLRADVFIGNDDDRFAGALALVALGTQPSGREDFFVANADAVFHPAASLRNPFLQGEVRGVVRLEGAQSSMGGYVQVQGDRHNLAAGGNFALLAPLGVFDIIIGAPGYLSAIIPAAEIQPGEVLRIPELTLPFGDANGDGRIDIQDLNLAANNFGRTIEVVAPP